MYAFGGGKTAVSFTNSVTLSKQEFIATQGQTAFEVTDFLLADYNIVIVDDIPQTSNQSRTGQNITFVSGLNEGSKVVVYGISGTVTGTAKKQEYIAVEGQTIFTVTSFILADAFIFIMDDIIQTNVIRTGNNISFPSGASVGAKITIYG